MKFLNDIKALLRGLGIAGKHLGRRAITIQYPEQKCDIPQVSRGIIVLLSDKETGELNCTGCHLCERACPSAAIRIDAPRDEETKKRELRGFEIDFALCCFCGLCEETCNFVAIKMDPRYEFSTPDKSDLTWDIHKLQEMGLSTTYTPKPKKEKKAVAKKAEAAGDEKPRTNEATPGKPIPQPANPTETEQAAEEANKAGDAAEEGQVS